MTDQATAEAPADNAPLTLDEAAAAYSERRKEPAAESATEPATAVKESAVEADTAPEGTTVEDQGTEPEIPAIEPPKSWSKDAHDRWSKLDRETQEFLASRDSEDQKAIKRNLQEAAEARKAAEADQSKWKQEREQYVAKQAAYAKALESVHQSEFGDLQTMDDVRKMQAEDPFRFQQWQIRQMELAQAKAETQANEQHAAQEKQGKRVSYEIEQNKRLIELVPEMAEPAKAAVLRERAIAMLNDDLGLSNDQLGQWMQSDTGHEILSNAGIQKLMADGLKYRDLLKAPKAVSAKPVPPVQRPGAKQPSGAANDAKIQALRNKVNDTGSLDDAFDLYRARKAANS